MPLILAQNEITASGHTYDDRTGVSYEYPKKYKNAIQPGERFIYYMGRRQQNTMNGRQVYFGTGVIGHVHPSPNSKDLLECDLLDYTPFVEPIFFKNADGSYREPRAEVQRGYFRNGVRVIAEEDFDKILAAADASSIEPRLVPTGLVNLSYAPEETRSAVERYSVDVALAMLREESPGTSITEMPHNNPGYDICVGDLQKPRHFVEVKGTQRHEPAFFLTEGERFFSHTHAQYYRLIVVHSIDLLKNRHAVSTWNGSLHDLDLSPVQWKGKLPH